MVELAYTEEKSDSVVKPPSVSPNVYQKIFRSYRFSTLSNADEKIEIRAKIAEFLKPLNKSETASIENSLPNFPNAAQTMFASQPVAPDFDFSRQEVLRINEELLSDVTPDRLELQTSAVMRQAMLDEQYFILYQYLARYWAVKNRADAVLSHDKEMAACCNNIRTSVQAILILQNVSTEDFNLEDAYKPIEEKIDVLQPKMLPYFQKIGLDQDDTQQNSDYFIRLLRRANLIRLCWLWDRIAIEMYAQCAHDLLLPITIFADQVSWSLYLFLASIHITGIIGAYIDAKKQEKENQIAANKVLLAHLKLRRNVLVNDLVWGFANLACCFWLNGFGLLAYYGDLVTGILLCMDLTMTLWKYRDEKKAHENDVQRYNEQLRILIARSLEKTTSDKVKEQLEAFEYVLAAQGQEKAARDALSQLRKNIRELEDTQEREEQEVIYWQIKSLFSMRENCKKDWSDRQGMLLCDVTYAVALVITFSILCCFYLTLLPITVPTAMVSFGALSLGATSIVWGGAASIITCRGIAANKKALTEDFDELVEDFVWHCQNQGEDLDRQKDLYLQILQTGAKVGFQEDDLLHNKLEGLRETANRIFIPIALAMTFLFAPTITLGIPTYVFVLLGVFVASVVSSFLIKKYYKAKGSTWIKDGKESDQPRLVNKEFDNFKQLVNSSSDVEARNENLLKVIKVSRTNHDEDVFANELSRQSGNVAVVTKYS